MELTNTDYQTVTENEDGIIILATKYNVEPKQIALCLLNHHHKVFNFRYTNASLDKILNAPRFNHEELVKYYQQTLSKGVTKISQGLAIDPRTLKMYFLINGLSVAQIHNKRNRLISKSHLSKLDEPYYQEIINGACFDEVAQRYHFNAKMRKNVRRNLAKQGFKINDLSRQERAHLQQENNYQKFCKHLKNKIVQLAKADYNLRAIKQIIKKQYPQTKNYCPIKRLLKREEPNLYKEMMRKQHVDDLASVNQQIFTCPCCHRIIHNKGNLKQHLRAKHAQVLA